MMTIRSACASAAFSACLFIAMTAGAQEYKIKLSHAEKAGDTLPYSCQGTSTEHVTATIPGQPPHETNTTLNAQLTGTRKVLTADDKGNAVKVSITVTQCTANGNSIIDPGTVLFAERTGAEPTKYSINNAPVDAAVGKALDLVLEISDPTAPDDDVSFGTTQPQKVGDSWPVNAEVGAKTASHAGVPVTKENISGSVKLAGVDKVDGKDVLKVSGNLMAKDIKGPGPGGLQIQSGDVTMDMDGTFAADDSTPPLTQGMKLKVHMLGQVAGPDNASITIEMTMDRSAQVVNGGPATAGSQK